MKSTIEYLNDAIKVIGANSQIELATILGLKQNTISQYLTGKRIMDDSTCLIISEILGIDPLTCVSSANYEREKNPEKRAKWEQIWNELDERARKNNQSKVS